ncbi:MAG: hypothetical protein GWM98_27825 [Nitrospinaceae bacterium]|nr:hypothetical protein [Nitrospinaceae bacterium]NIR57570.1 hypothetical protein [Nitrospinaceae bacterium]NIS88040.1 hypothetical protein [Nitrospinaceae bacterium]NIT84904.1 hypothetical protein [Nitrospinaceae bacterium]NIU47080.1 hypothetical protein [Nitrospinaceae bacterium]
MKRHFKYIVFALAMALCPAGAGYANEPAKAPESKPEELKPCDKRVTLTPYNYWYDEVYFGFSEVEEKNGLRTGRIHNLQHDCFKIKVKDLKAAEKKYSMSRTHSYKAALHELLRYKSISITIGKEDPQKVFRQVKHVTGLDFKAKKDIQKWWYENRDYLMWSPEKNLLQVDDQAKAAKNPVSKVYSEIHAHRYWHSLLMGRIKNEKRHQGVVKADMWTYHGYRGVKLTVKELEDSGAKEQGYLMAAGEIIRYMNEDSDRDYDRYVAQLQQWTGLPYDDVKKWLRWWKKYRKRLALSAQGDRLIPID